MALGEETRGEGRGREEEETRGRDAGGGMSAMEWVQEQGWEKRGGKGLGS